jgi:hypothetical protein
MKLLFLDIDGVLNDHCLNQEAMCGQILSKKVYLLNHVLRETGALFVLSSAWRYIVHRGEANLRGMEWLLRSHGVIAGRLLGITRPDEMMPTIWNGEIKDWPVENERGQQITEWIRDNGFVGTYAVVDDIDLGITAAGHPFVQTDGEVGLTVKDSMNLIRLLGKVEGKVSQ